VTPDAVRDVDLQNVVMSIMSMLNGLPPDQRERVLSTVETFFAGSTRMHSAVPRQAFDFHSESMIAPFSEDRSLSPKAFIMQKQPRTDVERVACLAYYLTHYRDMPHFKTIDLSKLNTEAAQPKFSNAAVAVDNATKTGYLVPATKGNKQLSAAGEHFVFALPDRDAARAAMATSRPRRRGRKSTSKKSEPA
jgi:hypothetical protein